mgnify:CR=1 FL=1
MRRLGSGSREVIYVASKGRKDDDFDELIQQIIEKNRVMLENIGRL